MSSPTNKKFKNHHYLDEFNGERKPFSHQIGNRMDAGDRFTGGDRAESALLVQSEIDAAAGFVETAQKDVRLVVELTDQCEHLTFTSTVVLSLLVCFEENHFTEDGYCNAIKLTASQWIAIR